MRVALGREPDGRKRLAGDRRTPEGLYHVLRTRPSRFHRFIEIDYPSREDADRALAAGRLTPAEHAAILRAHERGEPPPQHTALGGGLGLHGEGTRWRGASEVLDWTFGCIALSDEDIEFLAQRVEPGTPVAIEP